MEMTDEQMERINRITALASQFATLAIKDETGLHWDEMVAAMGIAARTLSVHAHMKGGRGAEDEEKAFDLGAAAMQWGFEVEMEGFDLDTITKN
jgi:hypothetical protein